jgi:hypothetical protein
VCAPEDGIAARSPGILLFTQRQRTISGPGCAIPWRPDRRPDHRSAPSVPVALRAVGRWRECGDARRRPGSPRLPPSRRCGEPRECGDWCTHSAGRKFTAGRLTGHRDPRTFAGAQQAGQSGAQSRLIMERFGQGKRRRGGKPSATHHTHRTWTDGRPSASGSRRAPGRQHASSRRHPSERAAPINQPPGSKTASRAAHAPPHCGRGRSDNTG